MSISTTEVNKKNIHSIEYLLLGLLFLVFIFIVSSCDSDTAFISTKPNVNEILTIRANLLTTQAGQIVQITETSKFSSKIIQADDLTVAVNASKVTIPVSKNADGSYSFPLPAGTKIDTDGTLRVIFVINKTTSELITLQTGTLLALGTPPIETDPNPARIVKGTKIYLKANVDKEKASKFTFNWSYKSNAQAPVIPISGTGTTVEWTPALVGSYLIQLDTLDNESGLSSSYSSPTPIVFVLETDSIVVTDPNPATILEGEEVGLTANLAAMSGKNITYTWSYSASQIGTFFSISGEKDSVSWKPPATGSYYIRIEAHNNDTNKSNVYTTSEPVVFVNASDDIITTFPESGNISRGTTVKLIANPKNKSTTLKYTWSYALSKIGPFSPITGTTDTVQWLPASTGNYYIQVKAYDSTTNESKIYTSNTALVSVSESSDLFMTEPNPGNISRGGAVKLIINIPDTDGQNLNYTWSYSSNPLAMPFTSINGTGKSVSWTPSLSGSYYIKVDVTDNTTKSLSSFTSSNALVFVADNPNIITTVPNPGFISLGDSIKITANIPDSDNKQYKYNWTYASSGLGPFLPVTSTDIKSDTSKTTTWTPPVDGSYFIKVDIADPQTGTLLSFTSSTAIVIVNENSPFFTTSPGTGITKIGSPISLTARFTQLGGFNFSWSYGPSTIGPWSSIGGSYKPEITWTNPRVAGSYYIKLDVVNLSNNRLTSFISKAPMVFVNISDAPSPTFGM